MFRLISQVSLRSVHEVDEGIGLWGRLGGDLVVLVFNRGWTRVSTDFYLVVCISCETHGRL